MFSHVTVGTNNMPLAEAFYDALLTPLGLKQRRVEPDGGPVAKCWIGDAPLPRFYVYTPYNADAASHGNGSMVAFLADTPDQVRAAYGAALLIGGTCEGPPGPCAYGDGYYGAYLRDPDGNKIHIACRDDVTDGV